MRWWRWFVDRQRAADQAEILRLQVRYAEGLEAWKRNSAYFSERVSTFEVAVRVALEVLKDGKAIQPRSFEARRLEDALRWPAPAESAAASANVSSECDCPQGACRPSASEGLRCWRSGCWIPIGYVWREPGAERAQFMGMPVVLDDRLPSDTFVLKSGAPE